MSSLSLFNFFVYTLLVCNAGQYRTQKSLIISNQTMTSCSCSDGIGSKNGDQPNIIYKFSNGKSVAVCGFVEKITEEFTVSEFNVFDCSTGKSLTECDATQICKIVEGKDTLLIEEYKSLPVLQDFKWKLIKISDQLVTSDSTNIYVSRKMQNVAKFSIDEKTSNQFLKSLKSGKGFDANWEREIGFLEALSIQGNHKAWKILKNYESFKGKETDGAIAEAWKDAVSTVQWLRR